MPCNIILIFINKNVTAFVYEKKKEQTQTVQWNPEILIFLRKLVEKRKKKEKEGKKNNKEKKRETTAMQYIQSSFWTDRNIYLFGSILGMLPKHG